MKQSLVTTIFWALVGVFAAIVSTMQIPRLIPALRAYMVPLMFICWAAFFLLGLVLIVLIVKKKVEGLQGLLQKFLLLTGASAVGFVAGAILHNAFYALAVVAEEITVLKYIFEGLDVFFFLIAILVCPIGFLVGIIGSIVLFIKKGRRKD